MNVALTLIVAFHYEPSLANENFNSYSNTPKLFISQMVTRTKKIFVGGLSAPTTLEDVKTYFEQFGPVSERLLTNYLRTLSHFFVLLSVTLREWILLTAPLIK